MACTLVAHDSFLVVLTMPTDKIVLDFVTIARRIKEVEFPAVDWVVGVATGGVVPACLAAYQTDRPMSLLRINYRADDNRPQRDAPTLLEAFSLPDSAQTILLVDDVSVSGQTLRVARQILSPRTVITFVLKGQGDLVAFPDISECVKWPWKES